MHALLRPQSRPVAKKLEFYAQCLHADGAADPASLHAHVQAYLLKLEQEQDERLRADHVSSANRVISQMDQPIQQLHKPRIQVLEP